ncbi:hypothetical protein Bca4012_025550 [Brassica carinata]
MGSVRFRLDVETFLSSQSSQCEVVHLSFLVGCSLLIAGTEDSVFLLPLSQPLLVSVCRVPEVWKLLFGYTFSILISLSANRA